MYILKGSESFHSLMKVGYYLCVLLWCLYCFFLCFFNSCVFVILCGWFYYYFSLNLIGPAFLLLSSFCQPCSIFVFFKWLVFGTFSIPLFFIYLFIEDFFVTSSLFRLITLSFRIICEIPRSGYLIRGVNWVLKPSK